MSRTVNRFRAWWPALVLAFPLLLGCAFADSGPPGDRLFQGELQGTTENGEQVTGTFLVVLYNPATAKWREAGSPGSDVGRLVAQAQLRWRDGAVADLLGTWSEGGGFEVAGGGWALDGTVDGDSLTVRLVSGDRAGTGKAGMSVTDLLTTYELCYCRMMGSKPNCARCGNEVVCCVPRPELETLPQILPPPRD